MWNSRIKNNYKILSLIFLTSFVLRLYTAFYYHNFDPHALNLSERYGPAIKPFLFDPRNTKEIIGDRDYYDSIAYSIAFERKIIQPEYRAPSIPPPLYSIFIAIFYFFFGYSIYSFLIPQIILTSVSSILVFYLARRLFSDAKIALAASLLFTFNPRFVLTSTQLYVENLYFFLLLTVFLLFDKLANSPTAKNALLCGFLMGLAALCKSIFWFFLPAALLWTAYIFFKQKQRLAVILFSILFSFCVTYSPWLIRNYLVFKRPLISMNFLTPWEGNKIENIGHKNKFKPKAFVNWAKKNQKTYFGKCLERFKYFVLKPYFPGVSRRNAVISSLLFYALFPLGYLGLLASIFKKNKNSALAFLFIAVTSIVHVLFGVDEEMRHRLPVELFMGMFACYGTVIFKRVLTKLSSKR